MSNWREEIGVHIAPDDVHPLSEVKRRDRRTVGDGPICRSVKLAIPFMVATRVVPMYVYVCICVYAHVYVYVYKRQTDCQRRADL